jgi:hypothetical protein
LADEASSCKSIEGCGVAHEHKNNLLVILGLSIVEGSNGAANLIGWINLETGKEA